MKLEPPDEFELSSHSSIQATKPADTAIEDAEPSTSTVVVVRPKRSASTPITYKAELSDSDPEEIDADDFLANDGFDFDDDDDDDYVETAKETKAKEIAETPKIAKRRGRPPKNATLKKEPDTEEEIDKHVSDNGETSKVLEKKRKTRKRKKLAKDSSEESSDSDASDDVEKRRLGGRRARDERLFKYIDEFVCYLCPDRVEFDRFHHANMHYKELHNEPAYLKCAKCERKCYTPGGFINHMETHDDPDKNK